MSDTSQAVAALSGGAAVLRKGMTKQDLVAAFGVPQDVAHHSTFDGKEYLQAFYRGKYCVYAGSACYVIIENNKVKSYEHFKPVFTDDLN